MIARSVVAVSCVEPTTARVGAGNMSNDRVGRVDDLHASASHPKRDISLFAKARPGVEVPDPAELSNGAHADRHIGPQEMVDLDSFPGIGGEVSREPSVGQQLPDRPDALVLLTGLTIAGTASDCRDFLVLVRVQKTLQPVGLGVGIIVDECDDVVSDVGNSDRPGCRGRADSSLVTSIFDSGELGNHLSRVRIR